MNHRAMYLCSIACTGAMPIACRSSGPGETADVGDSSDGTHTRCPDDRSWTDIAAGDRLTCGVHGDGCIECWGVENLNGVHDTSAWWDYDDDTPPDGEFTNTVLSLGEMETGSWHACALDDAGFATCWGKNENGQASPPATVFSSLALAGSYSCGLGVDGAISCWGQGVDRLDLPDITTSGEQFVKLAAGYNTVCAIDVLGDMQCWDYDGPAIQVPGPWSEVSTFVTACAVAEDRPIECWTTSSGTTIVDEEIPSGVGHIDVCLGYLTSGCALSSDGQIECWGEYYVDRHLDSYLAATEYTYSSLACGLLHACGVTTDGSAHCWGSNGEG